MHAHRTLRLPEEVEQTLKILVMTPKQLASELVSEEQPGPAENTLDAGTGSCLCTAGCVLQRGQKLLLALLTCQWTGNHCQSRARHANS